MEDFSHTIPLLPMEKLNAISHKYLDIAYASQSPHQLLDIYLPENAPVPYPVILHFHGGAFAFGTKRDINLEPMLRALKHGYALVSVEYRMSGESRFPALIYDAKAAVRYVRAHAARYGMDGSRIAAWGPSAGGYLVGMLGATNGNSTFEDLAMGYAEISSDVQAVVDWCGPCGDFCKMDEAIRQNGVGLADHDCPDSPESRLLGRPITEIPELSRLAAPITHVHSHLPPFLICHGEADPIVPVQQSCDFATAIEQAGGSVKLHTFKGKGHHGEPWYEEPLLTDEVFAFLDGVMKGN